MTIRIGELMTQSTIVSRAQLFVLTQTRKHRQGNKMGKIEHSEEDEVWFS